MPARRRGHVSLWFYHCDVRHLIVPDARGLCCPLGGFHIDPWRPVPLAVVTHAHGDHLRAGCNEYLCAAPGLGLLKKRLGEEGVRARAVAYGERFRLGDVTVSLHPAGHVLGSAQVRVESGDVVWVASGDYKTQSDPTCGGLEVVPCDVFITESTFGLPIYRWRPPEEVAAEVHRWWMQNADAGRASVLFCYALGKAQRLLAELTRFTDQRVFTHGATELLTEIYRASNIHMVPTERLDSVRNGSTRSGRKRQDFAGELILAPPGAGGTPWMRRFGPGPKFETGFVSGWMRIRGMRRRRGYDRGFVMSDHADFDGLVKTIAQTGARRVLVTHGYKDVFARYLKENGIEAEVLATPYKGEQEEEQAASEAVF